MMYTRSAMPDLKHRLRTHDLGFLKIVADLWGIDLNAPNARTALPGLTRKILDPMLVQEIVEALPEDAREALDALVVNAGWMSWSRLTRRFGLLREVGPGKRDREKPYLDPVSPTETLWYYGLIGRDFLRRENNLQECAYIPDDLLELLPPVIMAGPQPPGRAASPGEKSHIHHASDRILDHSCTLLAALRLGDPQRSPALRAWQPPPNMVHNLLAAMKLITSSEQPVPEDARPFLEMPRGQALAWLVQGWQTSALFNELRLMPSVICEGAWHNDPKIGRERIIALLSEIPEDTWWNMDSFIQAIHEREPDFQRPAGDFDSWLVRDASTGESLKGIHHWQKVDGSLVRYIITGPMHWLGLIDLASPAEGDPVTAFRFSDWASEEDQPLEIHSDGTLTASINTPRIARYQISRFCLWVEENTTQYTYQLSPASLRAASEQGLKIIHLETLLKKYGAAPPPNLRQALKRWDEKGGQARIHPCVILRVDTPQILAALRNSPAGRFVGEPLGPTTAIINQGAERQISTALAKLGYLSDITFEESEPGMSHQAEQN